MSYDTLLVPDNLPEYDQNNQVRYPSMTKQPGVVLEYDQNNQVWYPDTPGCNRCMVRWSTVVRVH